MVDGRHLDWQATCVMAGEPIGELASRSVFTAHISSQSAILRAVSYTGRRADAARANAPYQKVADRMLRQPL